MNASAQAWLEHAYPEDQKVSEYDQAAKYIAQIEALQAQVAALNARLNDVHDLSDEEIRRALHTSFSELRVGKEVSAQDMDWLRGIANAIIKAAREAV